MKAIRTKIASRALGPGDRLPSIRRFAESMGVSPSTVVEAYGRLEAAGVLRARRGSGFYVTGADMPPMALGEMGSPRERAVDPFWVSRQSLDAEADVLKPGCGWMPANWMPNTAIRKGLRSVSRAAEGVLADYSTAYGSPRLRRLLIGRFAEEGLALPPEQIMLTSSGTEAIDLVCRLLLRPGDTVLVDDPCYFNFQALLRAHQVKICGIPFTPAGPDVAAFESAIAQEQPRLYITNSALHNPTGATISPQTAHRLLRIAGASGLTIVEDEIFADFEPAPSPRLAVLDGMERVIRIGSFSKTLSASIRCGYIAARAAWIESLVDLQIATRFGGPSPVSTEIIAAVLEGGTYRRHMDELRLRLIRARKDIAEQLASIGISPWIVPRGGFYLWCRLPQGQDSAVIAKRCMEERIVLAPGNVFSPTQSAACFMRFNVTQMADPRILPALRKAMQTG
ncbi:GntR family transcriptional regulator [Xaviernesmea oryzae]|uniref:GntR family transcriptional regulator n=2 Tax=Xaviernesmea oryzae TaxID=464029 RepID=A0A1Q9AV73_9HYPH|nr:GntR family transcriptional regulator [Xaviernesmea oryzae]